MQAGRTEGTSNIHSPVSVTKAGDQDNNTTFSQLSWNRLSQVTADCSTCLQAIEHGGEAVL